MSEHIERLGEGIAVVPALLPVDDVGRDNIKMEAGRHFQEYFKFVGFRFVFRSQNI